jgi:ATP-binding cassette subfamily F protein uup
LIEQLESRQSELRDGISARDFYRRSKEHVAASLQELAELESRVQQAYARWEELEAQASGNFTP